MNPSLIATAVACVFAVLTAGPASAQLPPDNAGVNEYTENVPGPGGSQPSGGGGGDSGSGEGGSTVAPAVVEQFQEAGPDGVAAAELAEATATNDGASEGEDARDGGAQGGGAQGGGADTGIGVVDTAADSSSGDAVGSLGIAVPIILGVIVLAGIAFAIVRRRRIFDPGGV